MQVEINNEAFDELQRYLVGEIVASVYSGLEELRLPRSKLEDIMNTIAFNVCCVVDGSTHMKHAEQQVVPVLMFAKPNAIEEVVSSGSTSFMHEFVHKTTGEFLARQA